MGTGTVLGQTMRVVAVAKELQRRGHEVAFLAGEKLIPVIEGYGLRLLELPPMPKMDFPAGLLFKAGEQQQEEITVKIKEIMRQMAAAEKKAIETEKPDVMLCGNLTGPLTAKAAGIPSVLIFLQPHGPKTIALFTRRLSNQEASRRNIYEVLEAAGLLLMEGMPELGEQALTPAFDEWGAALKNKLHFTGPLPVDKPESLPGQEELKKRHAGCADKPLVYVTIGGGSPLLGEEFLSLVLDMFREQPETNGVVSTGLALDPDRAAGFNPPPNVSMHQFVPGMELIKASDAVVFHGGSSTLMNCIACGRPAVVIPSMAEQEDNGAVLAGHGAGIVLDKNSLTPFVLAEAVKKLLTGRNYRSGAQALQKLGQRYGGAAGAAARVEELVRGKPVED
ncbi:hypothetical protein A6M21_12700 [Desulfotomaculum copahuensis]|uniref:Erythromycin biosynthesis protein CIII-like C-terminal domain-containing protein n=2 Tax=Desulfotomaculum copahuensis TaxID=1838280 RepID=A0A1B7LCW6_9FIRM|nr:hypothetical protein A6M21_12700 [Desulfotomaculum copahuensis]